MTSRFVSAGTIAGDGGGEQHAPAADSAAGAETGAETGMGMGAGRNANANAVEWEAVQKDLDEERRRRAEARKAAVEGGGAGGERSLYEILQANKAAKQAAFEEQNRIRNQFRALDDDEIEFLHGVSDGQRAEEERLRRETEEGLAGFRRAQQQAVGGGGGGGGDVDVDVEGSGGTTTGDPVLLREEWASAGRKRKRERERAGLKGVKRRTSAPEEEKKMERGLAKEGEGEGKDRDEAVEPATKHEPVKKITPAVSAAPPEKSKPIPAPPARDVEGKSKSDLKPAAAAVGLVDYGSDEDD
ncbi:N-terminal domain of NEFA-interacting nuclear protein NIP30-domain-containing protein [Xylaria palmicola]|nr:N-terminal domain of NEFA-interacting nuclear protein NIP30-domain-containing protein [Xylaria palmicola]